jgi:hypothetical protein
MLNRLRRPRNILRRPQIDMHHQHRLPCPCNYCTDTVLSTYHYLITGQELPAEPANAC